RDRRLAPLAPQKQPATRPRRGRQAGRELHAPRPPRQRPRRLRQSLRVRAAARGLTRPIREPERNTMSVLQLASRETPVPAASGSVLSAVEVSKPYGEGDAHVDALRGVSLEIEEARLTAIMGPSGSG